MAKTIEHYTGDKVEITKKPEQKTKLNKQGSYKLSLKIVTGTFLYCLQFKVTDMIYNHNGEERGNLV